MRREFPDKEILADLKIMDGGEYEAKLAFDSGANIVTVLGVSNDVTIEAAQKQARLHGGHIMVDMMCVKEMEPKVQALREMGVSYICVHNASDLGSKHKDPFRELRRVRKTWPQAQLAVAGGINLDSIDLAIAEGPEIIIVGRTVSNAEDPREAAKAIRGKLKGNT